MKEKRSIVCVALMLTRKLEWLISNMYYGNQCRAVMMQLTKERIKVKDWKLVNAQDIHTL